MYRFLFLIVLFLAACVQPKEGCTDTSASNYNAAADVDCCAKIGATCCCTYPQLRLEIYNFSDTNKYLQQFFWDKNNHIFSLEKSYFYLSDIKLYDQNGQAFVTTDTVGIFPVGSNATTSEIKLNNIYRVFPSKNSSFTGLDGRTFRKYGTFTKISFVLGVMDDLVTNDATKLDPNKPLGLNTDTLWTAQNGYVHYGIQIKQDTGVNEQIRLDATGNSARKNVTLPFKYNLNTKESFDVLVKMKIDYNKWFDGVDIKADKQTILDKLGVNIVNSFSIIE